MGLLGKVTRKTRADGVVPTMTWAGSAVASKAWKRCRHGWYDVHDTYTARKAGCEATFPSPVSAGGAVTRRSLRIEDAFLTTVLSELDADDVFWDVGANLGVFSCLAADRITSGEIVAIEPHPGNVDQLRRNLALNDADNVTVIDAAVGDTDDTVAFDVPDPDAFTTRGTVADTEASETIEVRQRQLDTIAQSRDVAEPTVMKLDIEGGEALAVDGMGDAIEDCRVLFSEVHASTEADQSIRSFGMTVEEYRNRLSAMGFDHSVIAERGAELQLESTNTELVETSS